jgi:Glycosyl hydrolase catalytic core
LLAFNEPEQSGQSNLSPQDAANAYRTYMTPFTGRAQLGSPAVSNDGWGWITEFMSLCGDCGVTFIAVHWYNDHTLFDDFQNWVNSACSFGLQVWITEVGLISQ